MNNKTTADLLIEKWAPVLDAKEAGTIKGHNKRFVTATVLENQEIAMRDAAEIQLMTEAAPANSVTGGGISNWNPILISLVRRALPNLIAFDIGGVQPMTGPTGLIFAMRSRYTTQTGTEALFQEADSDFSGTGIHGGDSSSLVGTGAAADVGANTALLGAGTGDTVADNFGYGEGMSTSAAEDLGSVANPFGEMAFSIEKATVTAKERGLKSGYTLELAQDLKAIHGLDAEAELANILSTEVLAEINREFIRTINLKAKLGAQTPNVAAAGKFNLGTDADGRWQAEKAKGLLLQLEFEANQIAKDTRRGKGNFLLCSSNVASTLKASGVIDYAPALDAKNKLEVDDTGNTFAGTINGNMKVYIDPYSTVDYATVGYRGPNPYDAGIFYAPYVPLTMVRAIDQDTFQPRIGFKTRYGMVANPYAEGSAAPANDTGNNRANVYFRIFKVDGILV